LDRVLADELGCGRRRARVLLGSGSVRVAGKRAAASYVVTAGDRIAVEGGAAEEDVAKRAVAQEDEASRPARTIWSSSDFIVLDKPAGMHSHAGRGPWSLADHLLGEFPAQGAVGSPIEAGLVHRLDRDTSGVMLAATNAAAYARLRAEFASHRVTKRYLALVGGAVERRFDVTDALARRSTRVVLARRRDRALRAHSSIVPLEVGAAWSLVEVTIATGVTHQVRAHLSLAGHPILGDAKYGGPPPPPGTRRGQLLHAFSISLAKDGSFAVAAPADFVKALSSLRGRG
jgi:23S rRNA pseudouridine1911/1915/1917 synthase